LLATWKLALTERYPSVKEAAAPEPASAAAPPAVPTFIPSMPRSLVSTNREPLTLAYVYAGRAPFLDLLLRHTLSALHAGILDELHLWSLCRSTGDADYLQALMSQQVPKVFFGKDPGRTEIPDPPKSYKYIMSLYASALQPTDIILKLDDDVVYMVGLDRLVQTARSRPDIGVLFPNIVNNDVGAAWQLHDGMLSEADLLQCNSTVVEHLMLPPLEKGAINSTSTAICSSIDQVPLTGWVKPAWFLDPGCANAAFAKFLANPGTFKQDILHVWHHNRTSINVFAMTGASFRQFAALTTICHGDDEGALAWSNITRGMLMDAVAVHYGFGSQVTSGELINVGNFERLAPPRGQLPDPSAYDYQETWRPFVFYALGLIGIVMMGCCLLCYCRMNLAPESGTCMYSPRCAQGTFEDGSSRCSTWVQ